MLYTRYIYRSMLCSTKTTAKQSVVQAKQRLKFMNTDVSCMTVKIASSTTAMHNAARPTKCQEDVNRIKLYMVNLNTMACI